MTRRQGHDKAHEVPRAVCTVQGEGAALLCRGLVRGFGSGKARVRALDGVTVALARGTVTGLVGPDGAGKTTLLRIAAGLLVPDEGEMTVLGHDAVRDPLAIQSRIGYMPQRFGLYEDLTVAENLTLYADLQGVTYEARKRRWPHLMRLTGLAPFMDRLAGRLSGGMKQKLGLACTLVKSPDMLLLDEPTVGVDPLSRRELWNIVHGLVREDGITVLVSTAYLDEAEMCDRVLVLAGGRVLGDAQPADYLKGLAGCAFAVAPDGRPPREVQHGLYGVPGVLDATVRDGRVHLLCATPRTVESLPGDGPFMPRPLRFEDGFMALFRRRRADGETPSAPDAAGEGQNLTHVAPAEADVSGALGASGASGGVAGRVGRAGPDMLEGRDDLRTVTPPPAGDGDGASSSASRPVVLASSGNDTVTGHSSEGAHPHAVPGPALVEVRGLERRFGAFRAVHDVSFDVRQGEVFGLLGPNGAGKSTTFRMLCGLLPPTAGTLRVGGVDLRTAAAEARRQVGYVAQRFSQYGGLSVRENLDFYAGAYGLRGARRNERILWALEEMGLAPWRDTAAGTLPLGHRQRLALACALLHEPRILFLDEVTSGVDPLARRAFWRRITGLARDGVTIIVTTHFLEEAEYCDRLAVLAGGELLALGTPDDVRALGGGTSIEEAFITLVERRRASPQGGAPAGESTSGDAAVVPDSLGLEGPQGETTGLSSSPGTSQATSPARLSPPSHDDAPSFAVCPASSRPGPSHPGPSVDGAVCPAMEGAGGAERAERAATRAKDDVSPLQAYLMRMRGLLVKEALQIVCDPSSIAIALVMPVVLLLLFGYGVSLDARNIPVAVVLDERSDEAESLAARFLSGTTFKGAVYRDAAAALEDFRQRRVEAMVRVPEGFARGLQAGGTPVVQLVVNGVDANRARLVMGYVNGAWQGWLASRATGRPGYPSMVTMQDDGTPLRGGPPVNVSARVWFNPEAESRNYLVPGLVVLVMTLIGTLLTALVMAREWERGTMEALLVTPVRIGELLVGKLLPYFVLGMAGMGLCTSLALWLFDVPLRGSALVLLGMASLFLLAALGMGLLISVLARNQFVAGQAAILVAFLPAFFLSGFIFDLAAAPAPIRAVSHLIAARYFASSLKTIFLAGDVTAVLLPDALALAILATVLLGLARRRMHKRLE